MTSVHMKNEQTACQPEYFDRFRQYFRFSLDEINLPKDCQILQSVKHEIIVTFAWNQVGSNKQVQVLENLFIRVIDNGIRNKWQQLVLTPELLTNLLKNIDAGVLQKCKSELNPIDFPIIDAAKVSEIRAWFWRLRHEDSNNATNVVTKFHLKIDYSDIKRLDWNLTGEAAYLSCDVINYYLRLLTERNENKDLPKIYSMPADIWTLYSHNGYEDVREWDWMKKFHLNFDILLIPIWKCDHWCLATVHMKLKTIRYFDSLGLGHGEPNLKKVFELLNYQSQKKNEIELNKNEWDLKVAANIPKQENDYDCGVFCCQYAEFISRNRPLKFQDNDMKYFRKKMLYEIYKEEMLN